MSTTPTWPSTDANGLALTDATSLRVEGAVIVFARQAATPTTAIYYNVRLPSARVDADQAPYAGWQQLDLSESDAAPDTDGTAIPALLRVAGMDLITVDAAAAVPAPANAAFRVVSDGTYVSIFRPSTHGTLYVNRFIKLETPAPNPAAGRDPSAPSTVTSYTLVPAWEVRYQRSSLRDTPASSADTLGHRDMLGYPFVEPTQELATAALAAIAGGATGGIATGNFAVLLVPSKSGISRWTIVVANGAASSAAPNTISVISYPQLDDGLFDLSPADATAFSIAPQLATSSSPQALTVLGGIDAVVYNQQESLQSESEAALAGGLHLVVGAAVSAPGLTAALVSFDFSVGDDGSLPAPPSGQTAQLIDGTLSNGTFTPRSAASYPVPSTAIDTTPAGTVAATVLGSVRPAGPVTLLAGGDGLVHCYFAGPPPSAFPTENPLSVAQFSPLVTRPTAYPQWLAGQQAGQLALVAAVPGTAYDGTTVAIADAAVAPSGFCDVTITYGAGAMLPNETWTGVPREVDAFVAVLSGTAATTATSQTVLAGSAPYFDYAGDTALAPLPLGSATAPTGWLTFVGVRPDVALKTVTSAVTGGLVTLTLAFTAGGATATQTWSNLPADVNQLWTVLDGNVAQNVYPYTPAATDTAVYAVATSTGTIYLFAKASTATTLTIAEVSDDATHLNVSFGSVQVLDVPVDQASFVAALEANAAFAALFSAFSPDPVAGSVGAQTVTAPLDLRALSALFDVVPASGSGTPVAASVPATAFQAHRFSATPPAGANPLAMLGLVAFATNEPANGEPALMQNTPALTASAGANGSWVQAPPLFALALNGSAAVAVPVGTTQSELLAPGDAMTVELWVAPSETSASQLVQYAGSTPPSAGGVQPAYALGTAGRTALTFGPVTGDIPSSALVPSQPLATSFWQNAFTWELWVNPQSAPASTGSLLQLVDPSNTATPALELALSTTLQPVVVITDPANPAQSVSYPSSATLPSAQWSHLALTGSYDAASKQCAFLLYLDANPVAILNQTVSVTPPQDPPQLYIGGLGAPLDASAPASLAELRYWTAARTQLEIQTTLDIVLQGDEPGLLGYWPLTDAVTNNGTIVNAASSGANFNGTLSIESGQAVNADPDDIFLSVVAGIGGLPAQTVATLLRADEWNHVAMTFVAGTGVSLNPAASFAAGRLDWIDAGAASDLAPNGSLTLAAWVMLPAFNGKANAIFAKWADDAVDQSYTFGVNANGTLGASVVFDIPGNNGSTTYVLSSSSTGTVTDGKLHHVAVVVDVTTTTGNSPQSSLAMTFYVDGAAAGGGASGNLQPLPATIHPSGANATIGVTALSIESGVTAALESNQYFSGILTGVTVWTTALSATQIAAVKSAAPTETAVTTGAVAAWWFGEQQGTSAADTIGQHDAVLSGTDLWTTVSELSTMLVYGNGWLVSQTQPAANDGYASATPQFTIGASRSGTAYSAFLGGQLDEVRIWNRLRSASQIRADMFRPLVGSETGLVGYWTFDNDLADVSGNGNNGAWATTAPPTPFVSSTAPVSNEGPQVFNVYGGATTVFQRSASGRIAVTEFGDATSFADDPAAGVLLRGYAFTGPSLSHSGTIDLSSEFAAGSLQFVYVGQVQTNPTLLGYIEGAPPVPSENLTRPFWNSPSFPYALYFDTTTVALTEADDKTVSFSSSKNDSVAIDILFSLGYNVDQQGDAGIGISTSFTKEAGQLGAKYKTSLVFGETDAETVASTWTTTTTDRLGLRGDWELEGVENHVNPVVGRRFLPENIGYALVLSYTSDVYMMQLTGSGKSVGTIAIPSADIPPDKNIIPFEINPRYVKNGTLDGKVGYANDPDYLDADYRRGSYFKPAEAYRLKASIDRTYASLLSFYDQFDSVSRGKAQNTDLSDAERQQLVGFGQEPVAAQGLVNSYVWTSVGGLHAAEEKFSAQRVSTVSGTYKSVHQGGVLATVKYGPLGFFVNFDFMAGQQLDVTVSKAKTTNTSFGMTVTAVGESFLPTWITDTSAAAGGYYTTNPAPGKVDAYRFMTIYLPPSADNASVFSDDVIDDDWLRSEDPNAVALRQADVSGSVWRVLHRVTYVNRTPPVGDDRSVQQLAPTPVRTIVPSDNGALIGLVQAALGTQTSPTPAQLAAAIATVMNPSGSGSPLGALVPWWDAFRAQTGAPAKAELQQILTRTLTYFIAGYATGALPVTAVTS